MPVLQGERVILRAFDDLDAPLVMTAGRDPLIPLITTVPSAGTHADALAYIARQQGRLAEGVGYSFAIADAASDEAIGQIGLWTSDITEGRATIGYFIAAPFRGRGHASDALRTLVAWASTLDDVARLQLHVEPWNEGSWRAAEACGFEREGLLRSWQQIGDERRDLYVYSLIPPR